MHTFLDGASSLAKGFWPRSQGEWRIRNRPLDNEYVEEDSEGISTLRRITIYFCFFTHYPQGYIRVRPFRLVVSGRI